MNYSKIYYNIIEKSKSRLTPPIFESHHIIPKSLGGSNQKDNLVKLTPKEHFLCHLLLSKMYTGIKKQKMVYALWAMMNLCNNHQYRKKIKGRLYETIRIEFVNQLRSQTGENHFNRGRKTGRTKDDFTKEWKEKISASKKGKPTWNKGITHSEKTKALQSLIAKNRQKKKCSYCNKLVDPSNFSRWHDNKCKSLQSII